MEIYLDSKIHSKVVCFHNVLMSLTLKFYAFSFFLFSFFKDSNRMHTDKEEEALINEEAILNIVENSQSFQPLSQRLNQTTVFSEYDRNVFSSRLFYCSTVFVFPYHKGK